MMRKDRNASTVQKTVTKGEVEPNAATPRFFNRRMLASFLMVSIRTISRLDAMGKLPPALHIGSAKRWARSSIEKWLRLGCPCRDVVVTPCKGRRLNPPVYPDSRSLISE